jgi:hypothetical protein
MQCPRPERTVAQNALISLFLKDSSPNGIVRRTTFGLMLDFLRHRDGARTEDPVKEFLASSYTGTLAGNPWTVSGRLEMARRGWALYARNEMLSLAWLTLFKNALDALDGQPKAFATIEGLAAWLISTPAFYYRPPMEVDALIRQDRATAPALEDAENPDHELAHWRALLASDPPPVELATKLLTRLASRFQDEQGDCYRELGLPPGSLSGYPLTLNSLRSLAQNRWAHLSAEKWLQALVCEVLVTHQRIAIRKMGQSGEDTLMFRSGDLGFFVHREMERIVRDLGLTTWDANRLPRLTPLGASHLLELAASF